MRFRSSLLLGFLFFASVSFAQSAAPLGPRIGATLEAGERDYFGLFPTIAEAPPYRLVASGDSVGVLHEDEPLLWMPREDADQLARLIASFEDYQSVPANPNWAANASFVRYINGKTPVPFARGSREVNVTTQEGRYIGFVLYSTEDQLVMASDISARDASLPGAYTIDRSQITALDRTTSKSWATWGPALGFGVGAIVGASISGGGDPVAVGSFGALAGFSVGSFASELTSGGLVEIDPSSIDDLAYFNTTRPPELPGRSEAITRATGPRPAPAPLVSPRRSFEWISVGIHGGIQTSGPEAAEIGGTVATSVSTPSFTRTTFGQQRAALDVPYRLDVAARPFKWIRVGAFFGAYTTNDSLSSLPGENIQTEIASFRPYAEAVLPLFQGAGRRLEISAGAGLENYTLRSSMRAPLTVETREPSASGVFQRPVVPAVQETTEEGAAVFYSAGAEIYTSRRSSLFVRHSWHQLPDLSVPAFSNLYALNRDITLRLVDEHVVEFSYREWTVGTRFHF